MSNQNYTINLSGLSPEFNFDFNGITYSTFGVNTNGYVWLGSTAPAGSTIQPIASTAACDGIISAFGAALQGWGSGTLTYIVQGTSPNRTLTIQWANVGFVDAGNSSYIFSMQIILNEHGGSSYTTGISQASDGITFLYSDQYCIDFSQAGTISDNIQIGLRGASNADYNDLTGNGGNGYGWPVNSNTQVSDISAGTLSTASIAWQGGRHCSYIQGTVEFTYNPTIATPTITPTGQQNVCTGVGVTFTGHSTLPASPSSWTWLNFATGLTAPGTNNASTYLANPGSAGNYFYAVVVSNGSCSRTSSAAAVVAAVCCVPPTPTISGGTVECEGSARVYYNTEPNKSSYTWRVYGGNITGNDGNGTIEVTWGLSGIDTVFVNYSSGGCSAAKPTQFLVTVNSKANVSLQPSSVTIADGKNTSFSIAPDANDSTGLIYQWQVNTTGTWGEYNHSGKQSCIFRIYNKGTDFDRSIIES